MSSKPSAETGNVIHLRVNGKDETSAAGQSVKEFLVGKGINPNVVACELNLKIIRRAQLGETTLKNGDTLEIIQMIGGG
jgi:thiamine biosynthesis protein ThiS